MLLASTLMSWALLGGPVPPSQSPALVQEGDATSAEVPSDAEIRAAVGRGVEFLLSSQEDYKADPPVGSLPDDELEGWQEKERKRLDALRGSGDGAEWPYEGVYRVRPVGAIPSGYRVGGTSIVCEALLRSGAKGAERKRIEGAVERSVLFVLDRLKSDRTMALGPKKGYDVRGWGHAYGLQLMLLVKEQGLRFDKAVMEKIDAAIPDLIGRLEGNQTKQGGWNYAGDDSVSPFMTGSTLLILFEAVKAGHEVDPGVIEKALDALQECRTETVSYAYAGQARRAVAMPGSSARSSVAELALYKAGRSDLDELRKAVDGFFTGWDDLLVRKSQQGTHKGKYGIAPYYFFFGHTYAALAIEELPKSEASAKRGELAQLLWRTIEDDGTWNDRIFPRTASYSTAMSLMALGAPGRAKFPEWGDSK